MLAAALIAPVSGFAQQAKTPPGMENAAQKPVLKTQTCTRDSLKRMVDLYIAAQTKGDISSLPLVQGIHYIENMVSADITKSGILQKPVKIDYSFSAFDTATCQTYTEVVVANGAEPYIFATRMRVLLDKITEVETIWTTTGHWLFDADSYLKYVKLQNWGEIPYVRQNKRETLLHAANSYLDAFVDATLDIVPWGYPCVRIEGGAYTARDGETPDSGCHPGVPSGVNIVNRRYIVDETLGTIAVFCTFGGGTPGGGSGAPDMHLFRVENGVLRYVHTMTHMLQSSFQGPMPKGSEYTKPKGGGGAGGGMGKPKP
jgi:hypothetical protein